MRTRCFVLLILSLAAAPTASAAGPWRRAYVVDARLAALRDEPDLSARVRVRLGAAREVAVVERRAGRDGSRWVRVAVTRRTRGWLLADAVAWPGSDERRVAAMLAEAKGFARLRLARLALDHFPRLRAEAAAALGEEADAAAGELTRAVARRLGPLPGASPAEVRALMLSDPLLDRYNRLGVLFDVNVDRRTYVAREPRPAASSARKPPGRQ